MEASEKPPEQTSEQPPEQPRPPTRSSGSVVGTVVFVLTAIVTVFAIGMGGLGVLVLLVLDAAWPLAAPAILLYVVAICLPAGLVVWMQRRSGRDSRPLRLPGPLPIAVGAAAAGGAGAVAQ